jgi:YidC/Oxa1 family membrane protein insertase
MVDVELRQAPLIPGLGWCSNLAAPDMLYDWSWFMPAFVTNARGFFGLGPYFNLLPIVTIILFLVQQKMFMPPPTDEQAKMQQNIMKFMMLFIGLLFFKVASGLCLYFIASSLWGVAERKLLPKHGAARKDDQASSKAPAERAKPRVQKQARPMPGRGKSGGDGAAKRRKRKKSGGRR